MGSFRPLIRAGATKELPAADTLAVAGISFPAVAIPNPDPNTLDDYEEIAFSPAIAFATLPSGLTYSAVAGQRYGYATKIGRLVHVWGRVTLTNKGLLGAGLVTITGLPFAPPVQGTAGPMRLITGATLTAGTKLAGYVTTASGIALQVEGNTGCADATWAMLANTFSADFSATYVA